MPGLNYYVTSVIHLSLEEYHNAGLTPEETKACIEKMPDPGSYAGGRLRCEPSGINRNWNVYTMCIDLDEALCLTRRIENALEHELKKRTGELK
jgi:hypothetical protein